MTITREDALAYHREGRPGKIQVVPTKPTLTQRDLSLAYTPGVAQAVLAVAEDPAAGFELTARGNLVAVVSNGTAILGLGNRGPLASKPVMEGKAVLFKRFADVDVFDLEVNTTDPDEIIRLVKLLEPTFGGINLEDIKAPECFYIEETLRREMSIPVFHDDQHGTAIISGAGLLNALDLVGKKAADIRIVILGAGAAGIATAEFYVLLGVPREQILLVDSQGVIFEGRRSGMNEYKARFAHKTNLRTLEEALRGADMFLGLAAANTVTPAMVKSMARTPIIFALANPDPEIPYEVAREARPDAIVGTGRSDYPNQVNNVLGFPFIFRGALDVHARAINEEMKLAAAHALATLAREEVPDSVLKAYGLESLKFGPDYVIPKALDPRVLHYVAPAVAEAAMRTGVARRTVDLDAYRERLAGRIGAGWETMRTVIRKAQRDPLRVVFGEGEEPKIIRAAAQIEAEGIGYPVLLGRRERIEILIPELGLEYAPEIVTPESDPRLATYSENLYHRRQRHGVTRAEARQLARQPNYFGPLMVQAGDADAFISGLTSNYPSVIRPALQVVHTRPGARRVAGVYLLIANNKLYFLTDATVNIEPDAQALADIALLAADLAHELDIEPRIAMLSFSNFGSTPHPRSEKVRQAVELVRASRPDLAIDGEMQADTAVVAEIIEARYPFSRVRDPNILVFPDLEAANIAYKLLGRLGGAETIGPILMGMGAPVHVLQTGDDVRSIVHMAAIAVLDAQTWGAAEADSSGYLAETLSAEQV
ncbi:MAG TPA: NADP-dependent malic enzyme [Chloroflexi bacterium]|nr:NADP-dependent malic enzyme [Chloroflexota bacterium]